MNPPLRNNRQIIIAAVWTSVFVIDIAQSSEIQALVERKEKESIAAAEQVKEIVKKGEEAYSKKDYDKAFILYRNALEGLPSGGSATAKLRTSVLQKFSRTVIRLAQQQISKGCFQKAQFLSQLVLQYCPKHSRALAIKQQLIKSQLSHQTFTPEVTMQVDKVNQLLHEAKELYHAGKYDLALKRYEQILHLDKYHVAARQGQAAVERARSRDTEEAYKERRGQMIVDVDQAWERPIRKLHTEVPPIMEQVPLKPQGTSAIHRKLDEIIIPQINFRDTPLREALQYLRQRAAALDVQESDPIRKGVNIILKAAPESDQAHIPITLQLTEVPLRNVLIYLMEGANMKLKIEPYAILAVPFSESTENLITKEYQVTSSFISQLPALDASLPEQSYPSVGHSLAQGSQPALIARSGAKEFLQAQGVTFPPGASANYLPSSSRLVVKNTQTNLDLIDSLVEPSLSSFSKQVNIEAKFLEITQDNAEELGFDWLLGEFRLPFGSGIYGSGGSDDTPGGRLSQGAQNFPIQDVQGTPVGMSKTGAGRLTGANRSGSVAIQLNAMDALLLGGASAAITPGVFALAGVFTNPQFQLVIRALHQKKGVDLMTAPSVITKSGHAARIQIVREFRYPTQFDPPQIPPTQTFGISPLTPTTPTAFETKNTGIELDVTPTVGPDGTTIDLILQPKVTEFEGFINYGSQIDTVAPISSALGLSTGATATVKLSDNTIHQPVFSIREASTQLTITDGSTIALGGLIQEKIQKVQDKTPILGDIPVLGRLFRSNTERRIKTNLIMFVTAHLIDPGGQPTLLSEVEPSSPQLPKTNQPEAWLLP